jgi:hypothetical protein
MIASRSPEANELVAPPGQFKVPNGISREPLTCSCDATQRHNDAQPQINLSVIYPE